MSELLEWCLLIVICVATVLGGLAGANYLREHDAVEEACLDGEQVYIIRDDDGNKHIVRDVTN